MGSDNLELYRVELPPDWHLVLNGPDSLPPVPGRSDFDGDGSSDIAIFRETTGLWAVLGITRSYFGAEGDIPLPGDYNGDGSIEILIYRPSSDLWAEKDISRLYFGDSFARAIPADYDGDSRDDPGIFRLDSGLWAIREICRVYFGTTGDTPVTGNW